MSSLVSVIVVNHNRAELLRECLNSLFSQTYQPLEILVVDNGSTDGSTQVVKSFPDERIKLIPLESNVGFAAGNNAGIRAARGEFVALLNNDAMAGENWMEHLVSTIKQAPPDVGMCACKILFFQTRTVDKAGHLLYPDGQNRGRGTGEKDTGQFDRLEEALFPDGCAALYRRSMLSEVGGFDERFFAYADDADLGIRCRWLGWKCLYVPEAVVYHRHSSTSGRFSEQRIYWIERNRFWLAIKNFPLPLVVLSPLFTLNRWTWNLLAALLGHGAAGSFRRERSFRVLVQALVRAYYDGFRELWPVLQERRRIRRERRISDLEFYRLLIRFRISARTLAFQEATYSSACSEGESSRFRM